MVGLPAHKPDPFRASLIGGICAAVAVLAFLGLHWVLHWAGSLTAEVLPVTPTTKLMRPLAGAAIPAGLAIGLVAGVLRRHRVGVLLAAGLAAYVLTSVIATAWLQPPVLGEHSLAHWIDQGFWAALTYSLVAGAPLILAFLVFERMTRPAQPAGADDEEPTDAEEGVASNPESEPPPELDGEDDGPHEADEGTIADGEAAADDEAEGEAAADDEAEADDATEDEAAIDSRA
jgi:hypothetical protein